MANFLLTAPSVLGRTETNDVDSKLIVAHNATIAKLLAAGQGESVELWDDATVATVQAAAGWAGWTARAQIINETGERIVDVSASVPQTFIATAADINDGGSGYEVGDKLTVVSGDPDDADVGAILNVDTVAVGAVEDTITVTNGGSFTPDLGDKTAVAAVNISGSGTGLTVDIVTSGSDPFTIDSVTVVAGGTGYEVGDTFGITGATSAVLTIAAVDGLVGEVLTVTLEDGGNYVNDPTDTGLETTTDGDGTGATVDITTVQGGSTGDIDALGLQMVESLNATALISNASFDASSNVLTVAGAADNLGDHVCRFDMIPPLGVSPVASVVGTITDEGSSGNAVTVALKADNYDIPAIYGKMKGV